MSIKEISELVLYNPNEAWRKIQNGELDISHINFNILKARTKSQFNMTDDQIEAVEAAYWAGYLVERNISEMIIVIEKKSGCTDIVDDMLEYLTFGSKISLMDKRYNKKDKIKQFINMAWKVNELRNHMAHGRFNSLKYDGLDLSDKKAQAKFLIDLTAAFSKAT
jgi:hypothetical protein